MSTRAVLFRMTLHNIQNYYIDAYMIFQRLNKIIHNKQVSVFAYYVHIMKSWRSLSLL